MTFIIKGVSKVMTVSSHYFLARLPQMDPVATSSDAMRRFGGFSGCCGVYDRADLATAGIECERLGRGTTNVDFNTPMRAALMRLSDHDRVEFSVGREAVTLASGASRVVEKRGHLPLRSIKGFSEVQAYLPRLYLAAQVNGAEASRFARSLPAGNVPRQLSFAVPSARSASQPAPCRRTRASACRAPLAHTGWPAPARDRAARLEDPVAGASAWPIFNIPYAYLGLSGQGASVSR
ncbi:MAG TPA: hypothetical protein PK440_19855 [Candidatus Accumulibacter phosphatis]|nr:hypothetical protein [Candidatus Accumulibacter phosphatis]HRQ97219.1 hypothetical protein [Candidatus Accumulibacter phosphatis]